MTIKAQIERVQREFLFVRLFFDERSCGTLMLREPQWRVIKRALKAEYEYHEEEILPGMGSKGLVEIRTIE